MKKKELQHRSYLCEVRAEENENGIALITGRPIVYNSTTDLCWFSEEIEQGALNGTDLTDVRFLVNHDTSKIPLARSRRNNGNSTMTLIPDELGLMMNAYIDIANNSEAKSLDSAINRGDISGMSFMFTIEDEEWQNLESDYPKRIIKKIGSIVEVSAVTFPAYQSTSIYSRNNKEALENARKTLENVKQRSVDTDLILAKEKFIFFANKL